jgi:hypothetical protein
MGKRVSQTIQKAIAKNTKILIMSNDVDNIGASMIIYFLIEQGKLSYS